VLHAQKGIFPCIAKQKKMRDDHGKKGRKAKAKGSNHSAKEGPRQRAGSSPEEEPEGGGDIEEKKKNSQNFILKLGPWPQGRAPF